MFPGLLHRLNLDLDQNRNGAEAIDEFFAVACEAYFVNRVRFLQEFPPLVLLFDAFFKPEVPA